MIVRARAKVSSGFRDEAVTEEDARGTPVHAGRLEAQRIETGVLTRAAKIRETTLLGSWRVDSFRRSHLTKIVREDFSLKCQGYYRLPIGAQLRRTRVQVGYRECRRSKTHRHARQGSTDCHA